MKTISIVIALTLTLTSSALAQPNASDASRQAPANYLLPFVGQVVEAPADFIPVLGLHSGLGSSLIVRVIDPVFHQPNDVEFGCIFPSHDAVIGVDCGRFHPGDKIIVKAALVSDFDVAANRFRPVLLAKEVRLLK